MVEMRNDWCAMTTEGTEEASEYENEAFGCGSTMESTLEMTGMIEC